MTMSDLFKKLNLLVKSGINDILGEASGTWRRSESTPKSSKALDREVKALRQRINEAVAHEDSLQTRVSGLQTEIDQFDRQADEAVRQGNEAVARHLIEQMQRAQQRLAMANSDLAQHQLVTQDLIRRVNQLEAMVADVRHQQATPPNVSPHSPAQVDERGEVKGHQTNTGHTSQTSALGESAQEAPSKSDIEDDLSARRQRLSKPE